MAAPRSVWAGSVNFVITDPLGNEVPYPLHLKVYSATKSRSSAGFKMLDPVHKQPVKQLLVNIDGDPVDRAETLKGVEVGKGQYVALGDAELELIESVGHSEIVEIERFVPLAGVPAHLAVSSYRIVPNDKVPGSAGPVEIFWNGLAASGDAALIQDWVPKKGSRPSTLAIFADHAGLAGALLPFATELALDLPAWTPTANTRAGELAAAAILKAYTVSDYADVDYRDGYARRREDAIQMALSGAPLPAGERPPEPAKPAMPDMMAMLEASLAAAA